MRRLLCQVAGIVTLAFGVISGSVDGWAERRVALVVGNATYRVANISLSNPRNDAEDISAVLRDLDFKVVTAINATRRDMELKLQEFARLAIDADSALFFYAGHAMQYQGRNFLMPTDAELEDEISIRYQMIGMEEVTAALDRVNGVKILILDACRNNPLADRLQKTIVGASRSVATTRGLARIDKTQGMVVAYATAADDVANDGQGRNSPFTAALLKRLQEPGLEIGIMFRRVASDVDKQTGGRQRPETTISLLSEYYLNQGDRIVWERIKEKDDVAALRDFVTKYPSSYYSVYARNRLDLLERYAREREEMARRAREEEQRRLAEEAEAKRREELKRQEEQKRLAALEEQKRQEELKRQEEQKRLAALQEQKRQEELKRQEEQKRIAAQEEQKRQEELKRQEAQKRIAAQEEQKRQEAQKRVAAQEEQKRQDEQKRIAALEEQKRQDEQRRIAAQEAQKRIAALEEQKRQDEQKRIAALEEQKRQDEQKRIAAQEEQKRQDQQKQVALAVDAPEMKAQPVLPAPSQPQVAKANMPEQIHRAQAELKRLGCFDGELDGKMNTTEKAVKALWKHNKKPAAEVNITDDFIADLQRQPDDICVPSGKKSPAIANRPTPHNKGPAAASREPAPQQHEPRQPQQPARATADAKQPPPQSGGVHTIGTGF